MNKSMINQFLKLARLHFLLGGFILFLLGVMIAYSAGAEFDITRIMIGYMILFCAQLSVSYSNDYYDSITDRNNTPTLFSGGSGVLVKYPELKPAARQFSIILTIVSLVTAFIFMIYYSFPLSFMVFMIIGNLIGWFYTAPPAKLAYRGFGELSTMVTAGIMLPGMGYFVTNGYFDSTFLIFSVPLLLYGLFFIINVELPDMESDRIGKKNTFVVRMGRRKSYALLIVTTIAATLYLVLLSAIFTLDFLDLRILTSFSIIPLIASVLSYYRSDLDKTTAGKIAAGNIGALIVFIILIDIYLYIINL